MQNRRNFIKKTTTGLALAGVFGKTVAQTVTEGPDRGLVSNTHANAAEQIKLKVRTPLFCPYYSLETPEEKGGGAHYYKHQAFTHNPFTIPAAGMSGSPVIIDASGTFVGFMTNFAYEASTFSFDGKETLTVNVPLGQELFIDESGDGEDAWKRYNRLMMERLNIKPLDNTPAFWTDVEYCTWVEQKYQSKVKKGHFHNLNHKFVADYIDMIITLGYPKGKLTLDHGWGLFPDGTVDSGFGSWIPDPKKFPDFRKTIDLIQDKGFTPGLWIGFPKIHRASTIARTNPNLLGHWTGIGSKAKTNNDVRYLNPKADIFEYASVVMQRFISAGIRKFKIDMSYNYKSDMLHIHKELYRAAKQIDPEVEMEFHVPDIFFTKYADVIRTNDVWILDKFQWKDRVNTHYKVATQSAPGRGINLDHIGGNAEWALDEQKFLEHLPMYKHKTGYPLVSILPNHISDKCAQATGDYLWDYTRGTKNIISNFF